MWLVGARLESRAIPIVNCIGLSLGLLIWGATNMLVGWASGSFGLFGIQKDSISTPSLNYGGVGFILAALALYTQVQPTTNADLKARSDALEGARSDALEEALLAPAPKGRFAAGSSSRRLLGVGLALVSGAFYGANFDPPQYVIDKRANGAKSVDFVFSHYCGILLTSISYFLFYCSYKQSTGQEPDVRGELFLPAFASWFVANDALSFSVTFPLVTSGPGFVAAAWGVFVYGEIKGRRNLGFLTAALGLLIVACTLIVISK
ncbi:CEO family-domain-containing protein [Pelagophyceae sp. CCMP2097]|nr:CEO family-domain-containing protein [Pelagophyceae sp. CCMP2097]